MASVEIRNVSKAFGATVPSSENKTVPVGVLSELVEGDIYHRGALMAGALLGSVPVAVTRFLSSTMFLR